MRLRLRQAFYKPSATLHAGNVSHLCWLSLCLGFGIRAKPRLGGRSPSPLFQLGDRTKSGVFLRLDTTCVLSCALVCWMVMWAVLRADSDCQCVVARNSAALGTRAAQPVDIWPMITAIEG